MQTPLVIINILISNYSTLKRWTRLVRWKQVQNNQGEITEERCVPSRGAHCLALTTIALWK